MATLNFDATSVTPQEPRTLIPAGEYSAAIIKSEVKPTRDGQSQYLSLELEILDGEHKGRHLFDNLNLWSANETASRIAQQTLSAIGHAVGILQIADSEVLHNRPMTVAVKIEKGVAQYPDDKNVIKGYGAYKGAVVASAPSPAAAPSFAPPAPTAPAPVAPMGNPFAQAPVAPFAQPQAAPAPVAVPPAGFPGMTPATAPAAPVAPPPFAPAAGGLPQWAQAQG